MRPTIALIVASIALAVSLGNFIQQQSYRAKLNAAYRMASSTIAAAPAPGEPKVTSKTAWPALDQSVVIALGEALKNHADVKVAIYCANRDCAALEHDIDDAFQIAGWTSWFEHGNFLAPDSPGFVVGPPGMLADRLKAALVAATGAPVLIAPVELREGSELGVLIGRRP